jgi:hypothetical protein
MHSYILSVCFVPFRFVSFRSVPFDLFRSFRSFRSKLIEIPNCWMLRGSAANLLMLGVSMLEESPLEESPPERLPPERLPPERSLEQLASEGPVLERWMPERSSMPKQLSVPEKGMPEKGMPEKAMPGQEIHLPQPSLAPSSFECVLVAGTWSPYSMGFSLTL